MDVRALRWSDGLYAGLVAGLAEALFYVAVDVWMLHLSALSYFAFVGSAFLGKAATPDNIPAIVLGFALHLLLAGIAGIVYARLAARFPALVHTPGSLIGGIAYGLVLWLLFIDVMVPLSGMSSTAWQPVGETLLGMGLVYGFTLCEYLAIVGSRVSESPV